MCVPFPAQVGACALLLVASCGPPPEDRADAGPPGCGDGLLQEGEECDEGLRNGTDESVCTLICRSGKIDFDVLGSFELPFAPTQMYVVGRANVEGDALVFSHADEEGIGVLYGIATAAQSGNTPLLYMLPPVHTRPTSFDVRHVEGTAEMVWVEERASSTEGPWLFVATLGDDAHAAPTVRELPYPIPSTAGGHFVQRGQVSSVFMTDRDDDGELWVAYLDALDSTVVSDQGPSPAELELTRGWLRSPGNEYTRLVRFFANPRSVHVGTFGATGAGTVQLVEPWSLTVRETDAVVMGRASLETELAMLDGSGNISIWPFSDPQPEAAAMLYGKVPAGTQNFQGFFRGLSVDLEAVMDIVALSPDGSLVSLANNGAGDALQVQTTQIGPPCETCTMAETGMDGYLTNWISLDRTVYQVRLVLD